jgi:hypothetical protein
MASIQFTDGVGAVTLQSAWPSPANRFATWRPFARPIGEGAHALGTGMRYQWVFRTDYGAAFELRGIANTDVDLAMRLQAHLISGGTITVNTADLGSRSYATCCLAPDAEVELDGPDPVTLEYTVRLTVIDVSAAPVLMECIY